MKVTPLGSQTRSKGPAAYGMNDYLPSIAYEAHGAHVLTDKGLMIDWVCGLGAINIGHTNPQINNAVREQIIKGMSFSLPTLLESEVAELLLKACRLPSGQVRFVKTGSEACEAAVRIARKATGRDVVLVPKTGYHGWHSWAQAWKDQAPGVPPAFARSIRSFVYNDLESFLSSARSSMSIGAVLMEPTLFDHPQSGFLELIRDWCTSNDVVLIFDECVTGFRLGYPGAAERFNVQPDLRIFGKGLANGHPLACVVGSAELMQHADVISGTFGGEALSLAAAKIVLEMYDRMDVSILALECLGQQLLTAIHDAKWMSGSSVQYRGWPQVGQLDWSCYGDQAPQAMGLFTQEMARRGILWHPRIWYVCAAHTEEDINKTDIAMIDALRIVQRAAESNDWSVLKGTPPEQPFARKSTT